MAETTKKYLIVTSIGVAVVVLVGVGIVVGLRLLRSNQDVRQQASSGIGTATVTISPTTEELSANETATFTVKFNPKGETISGVSVRLQSPYTGAQPLLTTSQPTPVITQTNSSWSCPITTTTVSTGVVTIDVACLYLTTTGFTATTDIPLFTFTTTAGSIGTTNPIVFTFDPAETVITRKSDGEDVAALPVGTASITIIASAPSPTPTATPQPSVTPTPAVSAAPSPTATPIPGSCNTTCLANRDCNSGLICSSGKCRASQCSTDSTCQCADRDIASESGTTELPDSGSMSPTLFSLVLGSLFLMSGGSVLLAQIRRETGEQGGATRR